MNLTADKLILGWDVGGTKSAAILGTAGGEVRQRVEWPSRAPEGPQTMFAEFLSHARPMLNMEGNRQQATGNREKQQNHPVPPGAGCPVPGASPGAVAAIGVSIGGPLDTRRGIVKNPPHLPEWDHIPIRDMLQNELGLPAFVEHDAAACLLAEWLWGAARGTTHCIYLTCGTGCGAGVMIDGRILRGPDGQSPEAGHIRLAPDGPEVFGKRGCVESFCAGEGIALLAPYMFPDRFAGPTDTRTLARLADEGDAAARAVLEQAAVRTGQLCAVLADVFAPQVIALGSMARYFGDWWLEIIRQEFVREVLPINGGHTRIVPAELGTRLQDLSALAPCVHPC